MLLTGKLIFSMAIFNSYVKLPEGLGISTMWDPQMLIDAIFIGS